MEEMGLSIDKHRAKQMSAELAARADIILAMDFFAFAWIKSMFPEAEHKLHMLKGYAEGKLGYPGPAGYDIEDPFGKEMDAYRECARSLKHAIQKIVARMEKEQ